MQVSDLTRHYSNHTTSSAENMTGTKGIERIVASVREMTAGNIFEGTVNSVKNGQVVLGLSNGNELLARLDSSMQLTAGQSMFFQVKSNDGNTIAIRPYVVDGAGVNLTLTNALKAANLPVTDKFLTMANTMMQEQMPIDKNSLSQMARILMANPDMSVSTLVQMKKFDIPITQEMIAQFENYLDDKSAVHSAIDRFIEQLPQALTNGDMTGAQLKAFDSQFLMVLAEGMEELIKPENSVTPENATIAQSLGENGETMHSVETNTAPQTSQNEGTVTLSQEVMNPADMQSQVESNPSAKTTVTQEGNPNIEITAKLESNPNAEIIAKQEGNPNTETITKEDAFSKLNDTQKEQLLSALKQNLGEFGVSKEDSAFSLLTKISARLLSGEHISKANVQELFTDKNVKNFLKEALEQQLYLNPKDLLKEDKVQKLYKQLEGKMERLESLMQNAGIKDTPIAQTMADIRGNVEFMNQMNQAYTYVQIPLKMSNQNASAQLYVYTNKKDLSDPERDLTAFLHLDLEHLGSTDVSVRMHRKEVSTKFYMDNDAAYDLVEQHMEVLETRLRAKGYSCTIEVENEGRKVNFVEDFLKKDAPSAGTLHRYSFDVRA